MASSKEYLNYVMEQLSDTDATYRPMMGEYVLYLHGKVVGGIYDDRLMVKPTPTACRLAAAAPTEIPYPGAKAMLVADVDDKVALAALLEAVAGDLPEPKKKK